MGFLGITDKDILNQHKITKRISVAIGIIFLLVSSIASYAFPVYKMPKPDGNYEIGTLSFEVTDHSRKELYGNQKDKDRRVVMQVWYPAEEVKGYDRVPWLKDGVPVAKGVAKVMRLPEFILSHTSLVKSNSYLGAPISKDQENYPVIVLSHGWTGFRNLHTDVSELLASNGYIVIGINHTHGAAATVFDAGETVYVDANALPSRNKVPNFLDYANQLVHTYAGDIKLAYGQIDELNLGNRYEMFKGKLDIDRIGLLGHSTGGGAAVETALTSNRAKAVIGLDAWVEPVKRDLIDKGLDIPGLFLRSEEWEEGLNNEHLFLLFDKSSSTIEAYQLNGVNHLDLTMSYMYSPLSKHLNITGSLDGWEGAIIQQSFIKSFFDKHLKDNNDQEVQAFVEKYDNVKELLIKDNVKN